LTAYPSSKKGFETEWIAGSSPAVTKKQGGTSTVSATATTIGLSAPIRATVGCDFHALTKSVDDDAG